MRASIITVAALATLASLTAVGYAQDSVRADPGATSQGEEAMDDVDPAVLDRCRRQAEQQKLKDGPVRKAFMGTCVTPED